MAARDVTTILKERARALARPVEITQRRGGTQMVILVAGGERYAVEIGHVREVLPVSPPTRVPGVPDRWAGIANVRGGLHPVLDLARHLGLGPDEGRILVLVSAAGLDVALLVHDAVEAREIGLEELRRPVGEGSDPGDRAIRGTTADLVSVLDLEALLSDPQLTVDRQSA